VSRPGPLFALFDEYQSKENAKHTLRAMQENARQGFWNGSKAPYGYAVIAAEQRGAKTKKRLAIDPVEAEVIRLRLFREGDGASGPMGVKTVTSWLNEHGYRTRGGAHWGIGQLHGILTRATYKEEHRFNRKVWKTRQAKPDADHVPVASIRLSTRKRSTPCRRHSNPETRRSCRRASSPAPYS
jgi:site-specific DNA recombinase